MNGGDLRSRPGNHERARQCHRTIELPDLHLQRDAVALFDGGVEPDHNVVAPAPDDAGVFRGEAFNPVEPGALQRERLTLAALVHDQRQVRDLWRSRQHSERHLVFLAIALRAQALIPARAEGLRVQLRLKRRTSRYVKRDRRWLSEPVVETLIRNLTHKLKVVALKIDQALAVRLRQTIVRIRSKMRLIESAEGSQLDLTGNGQRSPVPTACELPQPGLQFGIVRLEFQRLRFRTEPNGERYRHLAIVRDQFPVLHAPGEALCARLDGHA